MTVDDVKVKLLIVALVAVKLVTVQLVPTSVPTVPLVAVKFVSVAEPLVRTVMFPLTAVSDNAFVIVALSIVLPFSVAGMSALIRARNDGSSFGPLVGPAKTVFAATGVISCTLPHV